MIFFIVSSKYTNLEWIPIKMDTKKAVPSCEPIIIDKILVPSGEIPFLFTIHLKNTEFSSTLLCFCRNCLLIQGHQLVLHGFPISPYPGCANITHHMALKVRNCTNHQLLDFQVGGHWVGQSSSNAKHWGF